ncbi:MAG: VanZ family protein [Balneolales bacterium]
MWTLITIYFTLVPAQYMSEARLYQFDKLGHFAMFGGWTGLIGLYWMIYRRNYDVNLLPLVIAGLLFGGLLEFLQFILPVNRSPSLLDMIANGLGCLTAGGVLKIIQNRAKNILTRVR